MEHQVVPAESSTVLYVPYGIVHLSFEASEIITMTRNPL
jgi:hypothetical protein